MRILNFRFLYKNDTKVRSSRRFTTPTFQVVSGGFNSMLSFCVFSIYKRYSIPKKMQIFLRSSTFSEHIFCFSSSLFSSVLFTLALCVFSCFLCYFDVPNLHFTHFKNWSKRFIHTERDTNTWLLITLFLFVARLHRVVVLAFVLHKLYECCWITNNTMSCWTEQTNPRKNNTLKIEIILWTH